MRDSTPAPFAIGPDSGPTRRSPTSAIGSPRKETTGAPPEKARAKLDSQNKIYVRDRIGLLFDEGSFVEDGRYANATAEGLPADGVVTGRGTVDGRPAIVVANDPTVKAGSWGARTVEKIVRATESALREELPVFWFVDSAGARITDQVEMFPGRRGAGHIFHNQVALSGRCRRSAACSGRVPRAAPTSRRSPTSSSWSRATPRCTSAARAWRKWLSENVSRSRRWAAPGCTAPSPACGDLLAQDDAEAIELAKLYFSYVPGNWRETPLYDPEEPSTPLTREVVPSASRCPSTSTRSSTAWSTTARSSRSSRCSPPSSSSGSGGWAARRSASSRTTRRSRAACSSPTAPTRPPGSSGCATPSRSRWSTSPTCPAS